MVFAILKFEPVQKEGKAKVRERDENCKQSRFCDQGCDVVMIKTDGSELTLEQSYYRKRAGKFKHRLLKYLEIDVRVSSDAL